MKISIVVPVLNEAPTIAALGAHLAPLMRQGVEVLIVDGGSVDGTPALARFAGLPSITTEPGRARQMNAGAAHTSGEVLLFLHADTTLPADAISRIGSCLHAGRVWGRFDVRISGRPAMLKVVASMINWRSRLTGIATGDQAMFMTREAYRTAGGFPDLALMEDIEMSRRLRAQSPPACSTSKVTTLGRRWETHGVRRTIFLMWRLRWAYWRGRPASELARAYRR